MNTIYKGCAIRSFEGGYVWDDLHYGAEGDDIFPTVELAKADIDRQFTHGNADVGEYYAE